MKHVFGWRDAPQSHGSVSEIMTESQKSECELKVIIVVFMRSQTTFILNFKAFISILIFEIYPKDILMEKENI